MHGRRRFFHNTVGIVVAMGGFFSPLPVLVRNVWAAIEKRTLPKGTDPGSLRDLNPADLDTVNLETMPLVDFRTMGDTDVNIDLKRWQLQIGGLVHNPATFTYSQILSLPAVEREVLLICPGVFSNHGRWKGISGKSLLETTAVKADAMKVAVHGRSHSGDYEVVFPMEAFESDRVFLAYRVNGEALPVKHGFPLRVVAEGHLGSDWAKYVYRIEFVSAVYEKQDRGGIGGA